MAKTPEYPRAWPQLKQTSDIESEIQGTFACHGSDVKSMPEIEKLSVQAFLVLDEPNLWCNKLEIKKVSEGLEFRYKINTATVKEQIFVKKQDYKIDHGWIKLDELFSRWDSSGPVDARTSGTVHLTINDEGDLIFKAKRTTLELLFYIPALGSSETLWGMSKRISN